WKWERLETQKRVAALFEVVLDDPATRPLYGRLERIANEGSLPDFEARIEAFAAGLIAREPEPRSGGSVCDASAPGSRSPRACTCTATSWLRIASAGAGPIRACSPFGHPSPPKPRPSPSASSWRPAASRAR